MSNNLIELKCNNCGEGLTLDPERVISFCPYCGSKFMIDSEQFAAIFSEREKTARVKAQEEAKTTRIAMQEEAETNRASIKAKSGNIIVYLLAALFIVGILMELLASAFFTFHELEPIGFLLLVIAGGLTFCYIASRFN